MLTLAIAIPFTVFVAGQEQDIRQYAFEGKSKIPLPTQPVSVVFKKAIRFSTKSNYSTNLPSIKGATSSNDFFRSEMWTVEGFIRVSPSSGQIQAGGTQPLITALKEKTAKDKGYVFLLSLDGSTGSFRPKLSLLTNSTSNPDANYTTIGGKSTIILTPDRWYHIAGEFGYVYDTKECYIALWIDGHLAEVLDKGVNQCPFRLPDMNKIQLGGNLPFPVSTIAPLPNITLDIDEVRVSGGRLRYMWYYIVGKSFLRPTGPFTKDAYTAFLWHFDDNFKDEGYYGYDLDFLSGVVDFIDANIPIIQIPAPTINPKNCAQVSTPARNTKTNECKVFRDSCIPEGWVRDSSCTGR